MNAKQIAFGPRYDGMKLVKPIPERQLVQQMQRINRLSVSPADKRAMKLALPYGYPPGAIGEKIKLK